MIIQDLQQELVEELVWPAVQCAFGHSRAKCTTSVHGYANIPCYRQRGVRRRLPFGYVVGQARHREGDDESGKAVQL
jgi:hypothetical protein